ncbi:acid phosphatase 1-like [Oryza glaberrima]|uniref:acid phosphatase 1-like n=1 Tax=Oryza glaberrima TaxID=4538 RepID=UPI00224C0706|nr:acid phosphatase 1-like [Oryza glaberrima]
MGPSLTLSSFLCPSDWSSPRRRWFPRTSSPVLLLLSAPLAASHLPFLNRSRAQPYDNRSFLQYVEQGSAPALAGTLRLYQRLLELGIKPVFLTVRTENQRAVTIRNLSQQGYSGWEKLVLQPTGGLSIEAFKSGERQKLVSDGYAIVGNIGDQWSDLLGPAAGARTFKLSNRMYYVDKLALLAGRRRRHCWLASYFLRPKISAVLHYSRSTFDRLSYLKFFLLVYFIAIR